MASMEENQQASQKIAKLLFDEAMRGDWDRVVKLYEENKSIAQRADDILAFAIANGQTFYVEKLLNLVDDGATLEKKNGRGNNLLHSASELGNVEMCRSILQRQDQLKKDGGENLIIARNHNGETPLFLSVLNGNREAFQYLVENFQEEVTSKLCRRNDGDTILHCAISCEYFGKRYIHEDPKTH
ncbi:uncharacterized protein [Aristolochia californica]|uniref:uncharacterized protein n=1 Tax=Aristolochia californica TaxID=171875 RepID=UPI0035E1BEB1